jgi:hypothetical protein
VTRDPVTHRPGSPRATVAPLLVRGLVHHAGRVGCQFRGVYRHKADTWRATVKRVRRAADGTPRATMIHVASRCPTPLDAALALAAWFAKWLGPDWGWIVANHRKHLWRHAPWQVRWSPKRRAFVMAAWVDGSRVEVTRPDGELAEFRTPEEAEAALHPWLESRHGPGALARLVRPRQEAPRKFPCRVAA